MKGSKSVIETEVADYWLTRESTEEIDWAAPLVRLEFDPTVERPTQPVTCAFPVASSRS